MLLRSSQLLLVFSIFDKHPSSAFQIMLTRDFFNSFVSLFFSFFLSYVVSKIIELQIDMEIM